MTSTAKHLLHLLALAIFLYFLAFLFRSEGGSSAIFLTFLVAGGTAEVLFWIGLFKSLRKRRSPPPGARALD